jgi:hypothetical protein
MAIATVVNVKGEVFAVNKEGVKRRLQKGDQVQEGEILVTAPGSSAELDMGGGKTVQVAEQQTFAVDGSVGGPAQPSAATSALESAAAAQKVIQALAAGDANALLEAEAAAAGLAGGGAADGGSSFVQLLRISEGVTPVNYDYGNFALGGADQPTPGAIEEIIETPPAPPTILVGNGELFAESAEAEVFEPALSPGGSNAGGDGELVLGQFLVSDPEGVSSLVSVTINGFVIPMGSLVGAVIPGDHGTLTITGFDPNTGLAFFSYELTEVTTDVDGVEETDIFTFTTTDGTLTSNEATVTINIVDDVPTAVNDEPDEALAEDTSIDIDVFANDTEGADGVDLVTGVALETGPSKGSVVYNGDGTFTYTPDAGEEGADSFTYTITDSDGDTSTATVNLVLAEDSKPTIGDESGEVDESALGDGSGGGTVVASGTLDITTGNDSIAVVRVNGQDVTGGGSIVTALGTLVITETDGVYTWEYTLNDNSLDHTTQGMSDDGVLESFSLEVEDSDGSTDPGTLTITVNDDVPTITEISNAIVANTTGTVTGNIGVIYGADGPAATDSLKITNYTDLDGIYEELSEDGTVLTAYIGDDNSGDVFYTLTLNPEDGTYTLTYNERPVVDQPLDFSKASGGPGAETLDVPTFNGGYTVRFDGGKLSGNTLIDLGGTGAGEDLDDVKPTGTGFGIGGTTGQTTIENGEGFFVTFNQTGSAGSFDDAVDSFSFAVQRNGGSGNTDSHKVTVNWIAYNDVTGETVSGSTDLYLTINQQNYPIDIDPDGDFDRLAVWFTNIDGSDGNIRIEQFSIGTAVIPDDQALTFEVSATDDDGDVSASTSFDVLLQGGSGPNYTLEGTDEADVLAGGAGNDTLSGGSGNDILTGAAGGDIFQWTLGDEGTEVAPAVDIIADFGNGTDKIDLRDLLQGESAGNLTQYLSFNYDNVTQSTTINVSTNGNGVVDQKIIVATVDLTQGGTLANDSQIIANLLSDHKLVVDS